MDICWKRADLLAFRLCYFTLYCLFVVVFYFLSRMVSKEGSGIRLYRFLIIAFSCTFLYSLIHSLIVIRALGQTDMRLFCITSNFTIQYRIFIF